ncbi:hypothetical protein B4U80_02750 [Leptotrombidium deliense]|uniref:NodB homology domain-containing protein n=1 Tax=Leptotrombidium deliense TaxID=299467 RepID=A0A443SQ98_9ACAR|nr:hypothetical protein B4U80_02750 [Leptotrombidium deliense]
MFECREYRTEDSNKNDAILRKQELGFQKNQREIPKYQHQLFKQQQHFNHNFNEANQSFRELDSNNRNAYSVPNSEVVVIPVVVKEVKNNRRGRVRVVPRKRTQSPTPSSETDETYGVYFDDSRNYDDSNSRKRQSESVNSEPTSTESSIASTPTTFTLHTSRQSFSPQTLNLQQNHKYYPSNSERRDYPLPLPIDTYQTTPSAVSDSSHDDYGAVDRIDRADNPRRVIETERRYSEPRKYEDTRNYRKQEERQAKPANFDPPPGQPFGVEYLFDYDFEDTRKQSESPRENIRESPREPIHTTSRHRTTAAIHTTTTTTTTTTTPIPPSFYDNPHTRRAKPTNKRVQPKQSHHGSSQQHTYTHRSKAKASRPPNVYQTPVPFSTATKCNNDVCLLPDCKCGSSSIPGGLSAKEVPQILMITFDDAINDINWDIYEELFSTGRKNPNGCPLVATYYVSHEWTDYGQVQTLYSRGHEMASHGITHSFGEKFSTNQWLKEINGQREILHLYGGVKLEDVRGMRAPFLQIGGNKMFEMLHDANFTYDSSMPVFDNKPPFWPYTLDYTINHECMISPCPTKSFPGVWEVGMVMWEDLRGGRCSMGDACSNPTDEDGVFEMLMKNFNRHYKSNRAPLGLFYHSAWFNTAHHRRGFMKFLDEIQKKKDVFFTTNWQMLQWVRNPTPLSHIDNFEPWNCRAISEQRPRACIHANVCNVASKSGSRFMKTCQPCPSFFPWVGKTGFE